MAAQTSRAFGISVRSSLVKAVPMDVVLVSTVGASAVMVMVSVRLAGFILASMVNVWFSVTRIPSRLIVWKP